MEKSIISEGPNSDEIDYWNGPQGRNWVKKNRLTDIMYQPFGDKLIECANLVSGEQILDIGCGCGTTTLKLAELVAPGGGVTALDISILMLSIAEEKTKSTAAPVRLVNADAETYDLEPAFFDVMFSQFGLMFFANSKPAFANFHRALKPGGRIVFVCWRGPEHNPWFMAPFEAIRHFMPEMDAPRAGAPASAFAFASKELLEKILRDVGFMDVRFEIFDTKVTMGDGNLDACVNYIAAFSGPVAAIIRSAGEAATPAILETLGSAMAPYHSENSVELPSSAWIVSARLDLS